MADKTLIKFFGVKAPPYPGASRNGCMAPAPEAVSWHVSVGGTQCAIATTQDFATHFDDFLRLAYAAGVADAKSAMRERLGL